jgi:hypothetical protein
MPRLTAIKGEIGTSGQVERLEVIDGVTPIRGGRGAELAAEALLVAALDHEHAPCDNRTCDITAAAEEGLVYLAADLLVNATEAPLVENALGAADYLLGAVTFSDLNAAERARFAEIDSRECQSCGARSYLNLDDDPSTCDNCLADLLRPDDEDDDEAEPVGDFTVRIGTGNAAMSTGEDVAGALANLAEVLPQRIADGDTDGAIRDVNGNTVGRWTIS